MTTRKLDIPTLIQLHQANIDKLQELIANKPKVEEVLRDALRSQVIQTNLIRMAFGDNIGECPCNDDPPCIDCY